jgi:hypothetical protein
MSELSNPTIAALVKAGQNLRGSDLKTIIQAADLWDYSPYKEESELRDALLADGYEISWDGDTPRDVPVTGHARDAIRGSIRYSILPTDAAPVPPGTGDQRPGGRTVRARLHKRPEPLPAGRRRVH